MYRVYLRNDQQQVAPESKTHTHNPDAALVAFTALVNDTTLDGTRQAAVLSLDKKQIAFHRFDSKPGDADYWRGREVILK